MLEICCCPFRFILCRCIELYEKKITKPAIILKSMTALKILKTKIVVYIANYFLFSFFISHISMTTLLQLVDVFDR